MNQKAILRMFNFDFLVQGRICNQIPLLLSTDHKQ